MATASSAPHPALPRTASPATAVVCRLRPTAALHLRYRVSPQRGHTGSVRADTGCSAGLHGPGTPPPLSRSRARSCALGNDRRRWHTSAPLWRRRTATATRRARSRPDPLGSSSSPTGARVPRLYPRTLAPLVCLGGRVVTRRPGCQKSEARSIHLLRASHFTPPSLLRLRHHHRNRYSLTAPLGAQRNSQGSLISWLRVGTTLRGGVE